MKTARRQKGFTLLEVLVALAIVALGMIAVFIQSSQSTYATILMRDKVMAGWIATNRFNEISLQPQRPQIGELGGTLIYAGREWRWQARTGSTPLQGMLRVDVEVSLASRPDEILHSVAGFLGAALPPPEQSLWAPAGDFRAGADR